VINIENEVFSIIAEAIRVEYPKAYVVGEYVKAPSKFPSISIVEVDNTIYDRTQSSGGLENHADVMYEVNVYSNKTSGKKSECKAIAALIDNEFAALGFSRTMLQPIPNVDDATIYRMTGRYRGVVSKDHKVYRR
jgi:hypothetical protein